MTVVDICDLEYVKIFGLAQQQELAEEVHRIPKTGGQFSLVDVSYPKGWFVARLNIFCLKRVMSIIEYYCLRHSYGFSMIAVYVENSGD